MDKQIKKIIKGNEKTENSSEKVSKDLKGLLKKDHKQDRKIETLEHKKNKY